MPVFRKRDYKSPKRKIFEENALEKSVERQGKKRAYSNRTVWSQEHASLPVIAHNFPQIFRSGGFIDQRIAEMKRPLAVLDWGCGSGVAADELARELGGKARVYGFSKDSYRKWQGIDNVKFIHSSSADLLRYIKPGSLDLIYSFNGLRHYPIEAFDSSGMQNYLNALAGKLSKGGKLVFNFTAAQENEIAELQSLTAGKKFSFEFPDSPWRKVCITRLK